MMGLGSRLVLLTGASGYVGGRLLPLLEQRGERVRCLVRAPARLAGRVAPGTEAVAGDVLDSASLVEAMRGVDVAYYLIHSMGTAGSFSELDRKGAMNFAGAARDAGVGRIIYLGGLGDEDKGLSAHLRSRQEVGEILRSSGAQVIELRASIVIGSGSLSFEMIRALVERLPMMITPRWVRVHAQPIAISDLLDYLVRSLDLKLDGSRIVSIGGADRVSYGDIMSEYARQRGLRRKMIPVPILTPRLSSLWLGLVTPLYARVGRSLIDSVRHPTIVRDDSAKSSFDLKPMGVRDAIAQALRNEDREFAQTRWYDAFSSGGGRPAWGGARVGNRIVDSRETEVDVSAARAFEPIRRIGGGAGYYCAGWPWRVRGLLDLLVGGVGMRRGRPHPDRLRVGDPVDWWRVEQIEPDRLLRLFAEMKLPGRAWLEFEVTPRARGLAIRQTAIFDPRGISGLLYWYLLYIPHRIVFSAMLRGIAKRSAR